MQQQLQMLKRAVGELIALESILVLPQNMKPVWVTCIVLLGWKTGMQKMCLNSCHRRRETKAACKYQVLGVLSTIYLYK